MFSSEIFSGNRLRREHELCKNTRLENRLCPGSS